jgi:hypothetical protein
MTRPDAADGDEFEPLSAGPSARADVSTEGSNVCRAAWMPRVPVLPDHDRPEIHGFAVRTTNTGRAL